jgi:hypothetical protein
MLMVTSLNAQSDSLKLAVPTINMTFNTYVRKDPTGIIMEKGAFNFNLHSSNFRVTRNGSLYLNFHASLCAKDKERRVYMVNPNTFVTLTKDSLKFESDEEQTTILFYTQ